MINELKALKHLHHPNIVQLKEVIDDGNKDLYLVMQHLPGKNLQLILDDGTNICREQLWDWARQFISALYTIHI